MYRNRLAFALAMAGLAAILVPSPLPAQITFQRTYGGTGEELGFAAQQTSDGGFVITGCTNSESTGQEDIYLVRTDASGDTLWTRSYYGELDEEGLSLCQTTDGGFIIAGYTESYGAGRWDMYLIKTDAHGDTLWTRTYGGADYDGGYSVQQTTDSGYIIAGYMGDGVGCLVKTGPDGNTLWTRTYDATYESVQQTADAGYIVSGGFHGSGGNVYLVRINASGDTLWTRTYGGTHGQIGNSVNKTSDGGFVITGYSYSDSTGLDIYVVRTNASGDTLWTRSYGGELEEMGYSGCQTTDGGFIIGGYTESYGAGRRDMYLIKTDAHGDTLWTRTYGGAGEDDGFSVQQTTDGGYMIAGYTGRSGASGYDFYLVKTDSLGNVAVAEPKTTPTRAPALSLSCEPNPFTGTTTVRLSPFALRYSPLTLRIYDASGRLVLSQPSRTSSFILHASSLPSGVYIARLDAGGLHTTTRVVLQR